jgi:DNA primase
VALYTKESRDRVRDAVDFLTLVSARTELRRAGPARYEGLCPFHEERTPSFGIDPEQKVYYCFGCQASGDVFTFVQETEGVDFKGALELLADRAGVELEREEENPQEQARRRRRERLLELLARTAAYYERCLWETPEGEKARRYLDERGLQESTLREFRVGYAPSAWDRVLLASRRAGFTVEELYATGLVQRSRQTGQPYDRFRARITFPLADARGRVLGFGARSLADAGGAGPGAGGGGEGAGEGRGRPPKYLNTADNDVYHKGLHLYGADLARAHATRAGRVIVCEGYTDTIALHQAGMRNAVGLMGTALTAEQVGELARMAQTVLLALDADTAGQEAMLRASALAAKRGLELRVVPLPAGADPAELIQRQGAEAMAAAVEASIPFVRFRVQQVLDSGDAGTAEGRDRMIAALRPVFATLPPSAMRMELERLVASALALPESLTQELLAEQPSRTGGVREARQPANGAGGRDPAGRLSRREDTERVFLALCIATPGEGERELADLDLEEHFSSELLRRAGAHLRSVGLTTPMADGGADLDADPALKALLAELVVEAAGQEARPALLRVQRLQLELGRLDRQIRQARGREGADVTGLATRRGQVKQDFDAAYAQALEETGAREG